MLLFFLQSCVQSEEYIAVPAETELSSSSVPPAASSATGRSSSTAARSSSSALVLPVLDPPSWSSAAPQSSSSVVAMTVSSSSVEMASSASALPSQVEYNTQQCIYAENPGTAPRTGYLQCAERIYNTVVIGDRVWMAENLAYVPTQGTSWCYVTGDDCIRLYDWATAMGLPAAYLNKRAGVAMQWQGLCPVGWHVGSEQDWVALARATGASAPADGGLYSFSQGRNLVASSLLWAAGGGADPYGFSALPLGYYYSGLHYLNNGAFFWMANDYDSVSGSDALGAVLYEQSDATMGQFGAKKYGRSVRCVKDAY